ncbi:hypothetical protein COS81_04350 [candidate division WWE3 bacterium CG06_land_8_20_14_3_00_42_16]|uniref:Uncharacterized protein n=2 Tax=Katanobacteria TaxID=422282 RepID=A0A2M7ALX3_UNCKA|nr:MAG: hypothetical protein AUJ38_04040 [bacterium CG1_02_42_9]PIU68337.1 MAG: hypothetical protein COS81_04350 [candidate division WWE3 bacterium CG06_land_8_20_14_3_00_42_16]PJC69457.1 MAG: hypothetical protein CO015_00175 [candidate division WWE3 bacterium CG_4_8_14_3_um_filter_42_11]
MDFQSIKDIILSREQDDAKGKYVSREFQDFGYRLAAELGDLKHKALYIKLAKSTPRTLLEEAKAYVLNYPKAKNKGALFMWKLKELKGEFAAKQKRP